MVKAPISIGELFDKISILTIKLAKIQEPSKLKNISKELLLLEKIALKINKEFYKDYHYKKLEKINFLLWDIEDSKRAHEKTKNIVNFKCEYCNYTCKTQKRFDDHNTTKLHLKKMDLVNFNQQV